MVYFAALADNSSKYVTSNCTVQELGFIELFAVCSGPRAGSLKVNAAV